MDMVLCSPSKTFCSPVLHRARPNEDIVNSRPSYLRCRTIYFRKSDDEKRVKKELVRDKLIRPALQKNFERGRAAVYERFVASG